MPHPPPPPRGPRPPRAERLWIGAFYNPHLARETLASAELFDHLAMADPPRADDPYFEPVRTRFTLLLHDYLGQLSEPYDASALDRARSLAEQYDSPWVAEHFQCLHTQDGRYSLDYVFPPLYTEEFLRRFIANAAVLQRELDRPLVMENVPGFFDVAVSTIPEPEFLRRFFDATECGFLLDLPHVWIEAELRGADRYAFLREFPLERVIEIHTGGVEEDEDLKAPWVAPSAPSDEMLDFTEYAVARCPAVRAVTFDAFAPGLTAAVFLESVARIRERFGC